MNLTIKLCKIERGFEKTWIYSFGTDVFAFSQKSLRNYWFLSRKIQHIRSQAYHFYWSFSKLFAFLSLQNPKLFHRQINQQPWQTQHRLRKRYVPEIITIIIENANFKHINCYRRIMNSSKGFSLFLNSNDLFSKKKHSSNVSSV